jgi:hypothetical protein
MGMNILEELAAYIFRVVSSTLKMEAAGSSKTVPIYTTRHHIPEDGNRHSHCLESLQLLTFTNVLYT